jgi:hypothetical protein
MAGVQLVCCLVTQLGHRKLERPCSRCGQKVAILANAQRLLQRHPTMEIVCHVCCLVEGTPEAAARMLKGKGK